MKLKPPKDVKKNFVGNVLSCTLKNPIWSNEKVYYVSFRNGARTKFHSHRGPQVLVGVKGQGKVVFSASKDNDKKSKVIKISKIEEIVPGKSVLINKNTIHCHGAANNKTFAHIAINIFPQNGIEYTRWFHIEETKNKPIPKIIKNSWKKNTSVHLSRN